MQLTPTGALRAATPAASQPAEADAGPPGSERFADLLGESVGQGGAPRGEATVRGRAPTRADPTRARQAAAPQGAAQRPLSTRDADHRARTHTAGADRERAAEGAGDGTDAASHALASGGHGGAGATAAAHRLGAARTSAASGGDANAAGTGRPDARMDAGAESTPMRVSEAGAATDVPSPAVHDDPAPVPDDDALRDWLAMLIAGPAAPLASCPSVPVPSASVPSASARPASAVPAPSLTAPATSASWPSVPGSAQATERPTDGTQLAGGLGLLPSDPRAVSGAADARSGKAPNRAGATPSAEAVGRVSARSDASASDAPSGRAVSPDAVSPDASGPETASARTAWHEASPASPLVGEAANARVDGAQPARTPQAGDDLPRVSDEPPARTPQSRPVPGAAGAGAGAPWPPLGGAFGARLGGTSGDPPTGSAADAVAASRAGVPDATLAAAPGDASGLMSELQGAPRPLPAAAQAADPGPLPFTGPGALTERGPAADAGPVTGPVHVPVPVPLDDARFAQSLGVQVSLLARDGVQEASLQLHPAEMGPVSVQIVLDGALARVEFGADMARTREVIERGLPELAAALREAGLTLSGGSVSQHQAGRDERQADPQGPRGQGAMERADRTRASGGDAPAAPVRRWVRQGGLDLYA